MRRKISNSTFVSKLALLQTLHEEYTVRISVRDKRISTAITSRYGHLDWIEEGREANKLRADYEAIVEHSKALKQLIDENPMEFMRFSLQMPESQLLWLKTAKHYMNEIIVDTVNSIA